MFLEDYIFKQALQIGFTIEFYREKINHLSLPCIAKTNGGKIYEFCQLIYQPDPNRISGRLLGAPTVESLRLSTIEPSPFAMPLHLRIASTSLDDYRNDFPFFVSLSNGHLLGYNAIEPVDFISYDKLYKTTDVERQVLLYSEERPLDKPFVFIKHLESPKLQLATFSLTDKQIEAIKQAQ